jgi:CheY-like chemotaxis protein
MMNHEFTSMPRILLVDDEVQQLWQLSQVMKAHGFTVVTAGGAIEAISLMAERNLGKGDLAILDYHMPVMNGCELADRLKFIDPELTIFLYSGAIDVPQLGTNIDAFIPKASGVAGLLAQLVQSVQVRQAPSGAGAAATEFRLQELCA